MRIIVNVLLLSLLLFPISSNALDLEATTMYDNIIHSLKSGEDGWFLHGGDLIYAKPSDVKKLMKMSYPDMDDRSLVVISYSIFYNGGYAMMEKPVDQHIPDKYEKQIVYEIKVLTMKHLIAEGVRVREVKKEKPKPIETKQPEKQELKKIEAKGRKL